MTAGWNLLLYAIGGNDHELGRVRQAIADMHGALTAPACNVVVQLFAPRKTTRHWISAGDKVRDETLPIIADASDPATLRDFINTGDRKFPGRSTALVLWAHSSGLDRVHDTPRKASPPPGLDAVFGAHRGPVLGGAPDLVDCADAGPARVPPFAARGLPWSAPGRGPRGRRDRYGCRWGPDPSTGNFLTNIGMKKAIAASTRQRVDLLGLNACNMASLEVVYELRNVADVLVACQVEAVPWPYGAILAALSADPTAATEQLAHAFVDAVRTDLAADTRRDAICALRASGAITALAKAFDAYAHAAYALIDRDWEAVAKAIMVEAQRIDDPYLVDLMSLVHTLGHHDDKTRVAAGDVAARFRAMRFAHAASPAHPNVHGLSIFCPRTSHVDLGDAYKGIQFRTNRWRDFLLRFHARLSSAG